MNDPNKPHRPTTAVPGSSDAVLISPAAVPVRKRERERGDERPDPTRFGDWEKNGRCIDF